MPQSQNTTVMKWLYGFATFLAFLIIFGGFVRLTRSGLSIVEWNPVRGALPPISQDAWEREFAKYQKTPEYLKINSEMTLESYKFIFYVEWLHRNIARFAGLFYAIPVFYFLVKKIIPLKEFGRYVFMGVLFISQAFAGWIMVASGLVDRPSVSHFNLTLHLLLALSLFSLAVWTALGHQFGFPNKERKVKRSLASKISLASLFVLFIQITYGGFTAGLKAGHVSSTWPKMMGAWIPPNLFSSWINIVEAPQTIVFIHRWLAWAGLLLIPLVFFIIKKQNYSTDIQNGLLWLTAVVTLQITLGVLTVLSYVHIAIALTHQANAILLLGLSLYFIHRFNALDAQQTLNGSLQNQA